MSHPYFGEWICDFCGEAWAGCDPQQIGGKDWCGDCKLTSNNNNNKDTNDEMRKL